MPFAAAAGGLTAGQALLGNIAVGSIIGGTIFEIGAQRQEDKTAKQIAEINASRLEVKAAQEEEITREEVGRIEEEKDRQISRLRVLAGIAGISIEGTPLLQTEDIVGEFEEEKRFTTQAGRVRQFDLRAEAGLERFRGKQIRRAGRFRTGTSLLTGAVGLASIGSRFR